MYIALRRKHDNIPIAVASLTKLFICGNRMKHEDVFRLNPQEEEEFIHVICGLIY